MNLLSSLPITTIVKKHEIKSRIGNAITNYEILKSETIKSK